MVKKYLFVLSFVAILGFLSSAFPVFATVTCTTQYGGGQTCVSTGQLLVNKKVFNPETSQMVDNLTLNDHLFVVGDEITYSVEVKNVGDYTLNNVNFTDTLPAILTWTSGELNSKINSLTPGQIRTFTLKATVNKNGVCCVLNTAKAETNGASDSDTAQICIKSAAPKEIPKAGPELIFLAIPFSAIGYYLRKIKK